jgi:hypothetical protein
MRARDFIDLSREVLNFKQNRHSELSVSQICQVTVRLVRAVEEPVLSAAEGTPAVHNLPMLFGAFRPPKPAQFQ